MRANMKEFNGKMQDLEEKAYEKLDRAEDNRKV